MRVSHPFPTSSSPPGYPLIFNHRSLGWHRWFKLLQAAGSVVFPGVPSLIPWSHLCLLRSLLLSRFEQEAAEATEIERFIVTHVSQVFLPPCLGDSVVKLPDFLPQITRMAPMFQTTEPRLSGFFRAFRVFRGPTSGFRAFGVFRGEPPPRRPLPQLQLPTSTEPGVARRFARQRRRPKRPAQPAISMAP